MEVEECTTCGANLEAEDNFVIFPCPACPDSTIARCERCKQLANAYECEECGFTGP
jgi:predicted RNA-binding Zn-ribbon protein involved in translation (DUF1610 family)